MESSYLLEKKIISMCFNPLRDSVFLLSLDSDKLDLTEEDLSKNIILKRYRLLKAAECNIVNHNYRKIPRDTYEGYALYFWELQKKIIVLYPFGYMLIYDYLTGQLNHHFQCTGKKAYIIRNLIGSPIQKSMFFSAEGMRNVYHISYDNIKVGVNYQKLKIAEKETVFDILCHPNEKYVFVACSDSMIRIYDYSVSNIITEVKVGLVDVMLGKDNKPLKNQNDLVRKNNILSVISMDINNNGTYLLSGNENGFVYLWDALSAIKNRRVLLTKEKYSTSGILSIKFIKTKQFENLNRFICLSKEGKFFIFNIIMKEENNTKTYNFHKLYENSIFNQIVYPMTKYNVITSSFINISYFSNMICVKWPTLRMDKIKLTPDKSEDYLLFINFTAKFFFIYDNLFPKINFAIATQMTSKNYEDYIPITNKNNLVFERKIFVIDNFFIYNYDVMTGNTKKVVNYSREFNLKAIFPLKFEVKQVESNSSGNEVYFVILVENENYQKSVLLLFYDLQATAIKQAQKFDDIIDFIILGNPTDEFKDLLLLNKNKQIAEIFNLAENKKENKNIEGTILRLYWTPFMGGYTVLYRNVLSELKFSCNLKSEDLYDYKNSNDSAFRLDYSEREIDICWKKIDDKHICAMSMIEKIVITDENMRILYSFKISLLENPNIISSLFWVGKTLFYSKGSSIHYFYGEDYINQKVFSSDQPNTIISGVLADRYILVSKVFGSKDLNNIIVSTPMLNPMEPILIGYLDSNNIDYNLVKEAVTNLFSNQFSQNLIDKLLKRDLKEIAWMLISDSKCSFPNLDKKVQILNDLLKFDLALDNIIQNKNLKSDMDLDELIWRFNYDHSIEYIKNILIGECNILINYGQFDIAMKILELLGDYPKAINLLLLSSSKEEYDKLRILFQAKSCLSYTDNLLINNVFYMKNKSETDNMKHYSKVFDNYKGESFAFGANLERFNILSIQDAVNKINKKNSHISNMQKKILSFGETPFAQYTHMYNMETDKQDLLSICTLIVQKIDQFYGYRNTIYDNNQSGVKKVDFHNDYSVPLSTLKDEINADDDQSMDQNAEDISENIYLTAYFHCDKGSGVVVEDITENGADAMLTFINPESTGMEEQGIADDLLWSNVLEEFEPLEYEDKWGRKSPGSHAVKLSKKLSTNLKIKHTGNFFHFSKKFTTELWIKIMNINVTVLGKDSFNIEIQNGEFIVTYQNKMLQAIKIKDYKLSCDVWTHLTFTYRKKSSKFKIFLNCDEILNYSISLGEELGLKGDINIGNANLDAEVTEIRIWKEELPIKFIRENYKSPLPILAENKRKLRMKINKQEDNTKKKFEFNKNTNTNRFQSFAFGQNKLGFNQNNINMQQSSQRHSEDISSNIDEKKLGLDNINETPIKGNNQSQMYIEDESINLNLSTIRNDIEGDNGDKAQSGQNLYEFNPTNYNMDNSDMLYPSLSSILNQDKSVLGVTKFENDNNDAPFNFKVDEDENDQKDENVNFDFNKDEFKFDK